MKNAQQKTKSPCNKKCKKKNNICLGCGRTVSEIAGWSTATENQKRAIVERLANRPSI
jgi:predicted Fe-S protein YdhL (DUF1289 family)